MGIKDSVRNWLKEESYIAQYIRQGFMNLFFTGQSFSTLVDWHPPFWKCALLDTYRDHLVLLVTDEEISSAIWSLKPLKVPGLDGILQSFSKDIGLLSVSWSKQK